MMDSGQTTCCSCSHSDVTKEGLCHSCGHVRVWCTKCGKLSGETKVAEEARNLATPTRKMATFAPPEPPKIDLKTAKKPQAQQEDFSNQLKNLENLISNEAKLRAKIADLQRSLEGSRVREDRARNDAERCVEMAKRIAEEKAKAKAELEAAQKAKEIADAEAKFKAEVAAAQAAKRKAEREASEAAAKAANEAQVKADADATVAAEKARVEAEAAKVKVEADAAVASIAAAKAEAEAAKTKVPAEKAKPIKFKDALGRKFNFPYEMCKTWKGMNDLICHAFAHVELIGQMVADGNYDLIGPSGEIILPQIWETVLEPDWTVTMHMWPIKEVPSEKPPPPGMTMRHPIHPPGKRGGRASPGPHSGRERGGPPRPPPAPPAPIPEGPGWLGPLSGGGPELFAFKPRKKQGTSGWGSLFGGTPKKATKNKKNKNILHSAIPSRSNPQAPLQVGLALTHEGDEDDTLSSSLLRRQRPLPFHSPSDPSEELQTLSWKPFTPPQSAEISYPSVSEFRVTEYTKQQEAEAERQKQQELERTAIEPSDASFIQAVTHSDAEKKQPEVEQLEQANDVASPIEPSDAPPAPPAIDITGGKDQPEAEQGKQVELVEDNVEAWDAPRTLLPPTDSNEDEKRQISRTEKQAGNAGDGVEPSVAPPTPPASDSDGDKEHRDVWASPPPTYVPIEVVLPLPSEVPLPRSPPLTPARTITPPPALPPLSPASVQSPSSPFGPRLLYAGRDGTRLYAPYQYEQVSPPQQERSPLSVVWAVVFCLSLGTIALVILTFGTTSSLIEERASASSAAVAAHTPSTSDPEFSLTLQSSLWAITNLIAGLIPACMHATRYRKWLRMNYAWLPAVVCLVMVVASVPVYMRSPALSNGLVGVANIPMALFIFFASWEAMREEGRGKGCGGRCESEGFEGSERSSGDSLRKCSGSQIELSTLG